MNKFRLKKEIDYSFFNPRKDYPIKYSINDWDNFCLGECSIVDGRTIIYFERNEYLFEIHKHFWRNTKLILKSGQEGILEIELYDNLWLDYKSGLGNLQIENITYGIYVFKSHYKEDNEVRFLYKYKLIDDLGQSILKVEFEIPCYNRIPIDLVYMPFDAEIELSISNKLIPLAIVHLFESEFVGDMNSYNH